MRSFIITASFIVLTLPAVVLAASGLDTALTNIQSLVSKLIPIAVAFAVLFFFWGLAKYILNAGDEEKKKEGRSIMIWGIIALFIMVSIWGLISVFAQTLGVTEGQNLKVPSVTLPTVN